jgi:hypothetical protein
MHVALANAQNDFGDGASGPKAKGMIYKVLRTK